MSIAKSGPDLLLAFLCGLGYAWCVSDFLKKHLHGNRLEGGCFAGLFFLGSGTLSLLMEYGGISYIFGAGCHHLLIFFLTQAVFREKKEKKLMVAVLLETMTRLLWNFSESFLSFSGLILVHLVTGGRQATMGAGAGRILLCMTCAAGMTAVGRLSRLFIPVLEGKRKSWYLFLSVPLACMLLLTDVVNWAASKGILVQAWGRYGLYENQLFSHGALCLFVGMELAAAGFFVFGMDRIDREERMGEAYHAQVRYYEMMEEQYGRMERLRHDMKNHLIALEHLVMNQRWEQAGSYLREMAKAGSVEAGDEVTGSLVMDALLYHKRRQAEKLGIRWQCDVRLPADAPVKEMDLCIIVGNMLDNAVEACERFQEKGMGRPFIHISMGMIKKCLLMEVRNSAVLGDGSKEREKEDRHGLGLSNIRAAAAGYNGTVQVEVGKEVFTISVLLPLCRETEGEKKPYTSGKAPFATL